LTELPFVEKIVLYGSRARGDNEPRSDIDLAIYCLNATSDEWLKVLDIIEEADTLLKIDCIRMDQLSNESLKKDIINHGKILYEKSKGMTYAGKNL